MRAEMRPNQTHRDDTHNDYETTVEDPLAAPANPEAEPSLHQETQSDLRVSDGLQISPQRLPGGVHR